MLFTSTKKRYEEEFDRLAKERKKMDQEKEELLGQIKMTNHFEDRSNYVLYLENLLRENKIAF